MSNEPGDFDQEGYYVPESRPDSTRVTLPGIFLLITGCINLLAAGLGGFIGFTFTNIPHAELQKAYDDQGQKERESMKEFGINGPEDLRNIYVRLGYGSGVVWVICSLPAILGGILMLARRGWFFAVLGAGLAAFPCLSPSACPCLFGIGVGIWALVVLFSPEVKGAFR